MKLKDHLNARYTTISLYVIVTAVIIYVLAKITDHAGDILAASQKGFSILGTMLTPLIIGFALAFLLYPIVTRFQKLFKRSKHAEKKEKSSRGLAVMCTILLVLAAAFLLMTIIISAVSREATPANIDEITNYFTELGASLQTLHDDIMKMLDKINVDSAQLEEWLAQLASGAANLAQTLGRRSLESLANIKSVFSNILFGIIFSVYFLLDGEGLMHYWDRVLKAIAGSGAYKFIHTLIDDAYRCFSGYVKGQLTDVLFMAASVSIALGAIGVKFAAIIGILTGLGNLIPYVGPFVAYGCTILVCSVGGEWSKLIISLIVLLIIQTVDGNVIGPKLMSHAIDVHPMLVIVALLVGGASTGLLGMLLAVPVAALAKTWFDRFISFLIKKRELKAAKNGEGS